MKIVWTDEAKQSLKNITSRIAGENPEAALKLNKEIRDRAKLLGIFPYLAPIGRVAGTRELLVHHNYIISYKAQDNEIKIVTIFHTARDNPFKP